MIQRYVRLRDSIKFSLYWIALVVSSLIVFMSAASHMQVKPLQFQAPTGSLDDVFVPDVVLFRLSDGIVTDANHSIGQSDGGSCLRGSNIENNHYELVSRTTDHLVKLSVKSVNSYRHLHTKVSCEEILVLSIAPEIYGFVACSSLLDMSSPSWTTQPVDQPAFRLNSTEYCLGLNQTYSSFRTVTKLIASKKLFVAQAVAHQSSFQDYPFDV